MEHVHSSRHQTLLTAYRVAVVLLLSALVGLVGVLLVRPAPSTTDTETRGITKFQRPSAFRYVAETNSCVVGGIVTEDAEWHVGDDVYALREVDQKNVEHTVFTFKPDEGEPITVAKEGALLVRKGENLGLELNCASPYGDGGYVTTGPSFPLRYIIYSDA